MIEVALSLALALAVGLALGAVVRLFPHARPVAEAGSGRVSARGPARLGSPQRGPARPGPILIVVTVLVGVVIVGLLAGMVRSGAGVVMVDAEISAWAAAHATPASLTVFDYVTQAGGSAVVTLAAVATAAYALRRPGRARTVLFIALVAGGQLVLANILKTAVGRVRPALAPFAVFSGYAFPSGHATAAAAVWAAAALVFGRGRSRWIRATLAGVAVGLAVLVGCSRVFLGAHWTSDVVAGLVLGWMWFGLCVLVVGGDLLSAAPCKREAPPAPGGDEPPAVSTAEAAAPSVDELAAVSDEPQPLRPTG